MDEMLRKELLRSELKEKNKGKRIIPCKYRPKYPDSAEREYMRLVNAYMAKGLAGGISTLMKGATASAATATGSAVNNTSNTTNVTQNNTFNNSYSGSDVQAQQNVSKGMKQSAQDATSYMAKGLAYAR